jgi:hypothetical protein
MRSKVIRCSGAFVGALNFTEGCIKYGQKSLANKVVLGD